MSGNIPNTSSSALPTGIQAIAARGVLRLGLFLPQYYEDPSSGAIRGNGTGYVAIDLSRAMASQLGVQLQVIGYANPALAVDALRKGECDVQFLGIEPGRQAVLSFTAPIFCFDYTYLVPDQSPVSTVPEADKPGLTISAVGNHASTMALAKQIRHATIIRSEIPREAFEILKNGDADVMAMPRDQLLPFAEELSGSKVLDDRFGENSVGLGIAQGDEEAIAWFDAQMLGAKSSGAVLASVERGKIIGFRIAESAD